MILDFGIRNFRSFDEEGVFLHDLQKINIFIGKNNSGKSNFIRFLTELSKNALDHEKFPDMAYENVHKNNGGRTVFSFLMTHAEIGFSETVHYNSTTFLITDYLPNPFRVDFTMTSSHQAKRIVLPELETEIPEDVLRKMFQKNNGLNRVDALNNILNEVHTKAYGRIKLFRDIIYISDFRFIMEGNKMDASNSEMNGSNIISKLRKMQVPDTGMEKDRVTFDRIQETVRDLLSIKDLTMEIPPDSDKIILSVHGGIRQDLKSFGTGIHQLIILCSALIIYSDRIICIEEPEIHLHPELQRKFLDFLIRRTQNRYFITTHSNTFLNLFEQVSIYHVQHDAVRSTCERVQTTRHAYQLIDDLGYKASDLLQANGIIWVEGPSDRNLINKWISLTDPDLEEGLHYAIMFYGGRSLANCTFDADFISSNLIPLLKINRNAYVVIDRDNTSKINDTKARIKNEIGDGKCWITKGREIENYINTSVVQLWLVSKRAYNNEEVVADPVGKFSELLTLMDATGKIKYDGQKNLYSLEISAYFTAADLAYLNLSEHINQLVTQINAWNQYPV